MRWVKPILSTASSAHPEPVHAADDVNEEGKERRFEQADEEIIAVDDVRHACQVLRRRYIKQGLGNGGAADQAHDVGEKREQRQSDDQSDHPWHHQHLHGLDAPSL